MVKTILLQQLDFAAILTVFILFGHATSASLSRDQTSHIKNCFGDDQSERIDGTLKMHQQTWLFSVTIRNHNDTNSGIISGTMNGESILLPIDGPFSYPLRTQVAVRFDQSLGSIEGMYAYRQEWKPPPQELITLSL